MMVVSARSWLFMCCWGGGGPAACGVVLDGAAVAEEMSWWGFWGSGDDVCQNRSW